MNSLRTENIFIRKVKELFLSDNYKDINVNRICKELGLKRQTFYYHYNDLSDLIFSMLLAEFISKNDKIKNLDNSILDLIEFFDKNKELLARLFELNADSSIELFVYEEIYSAETKNLFNKYKNTKNIKKINLLNFLLSSYISKLMVYYLSINNNFNKNKFITYMSKMSTGIEDKIYKNILTI